MRDTSGAVIFLAVQLCEDREGIRAADKTQEEMLGEHLEAGRLRGRSFERIMLLGGDDVIEAAHELNTIAGEIDWQATGKIATHHRAAAFRAVSGYVGARCSLLLRSVMAVTAPWVQIPQPPPWIISTL
ncbi:hypothetical protein [Streptomyces ochraceiscleroticus]|uniref:Uncharacterized protein n=1 Tax=Streptomyces ochraceiscleroticus TaxID=47761 RepID=A0ABW1MNA0_9ACTN|nr:hypothetical protein [Streptomyces ochraceiscleroticus]